MCHVIDFSGFAKLYDRYVGDSFRVVNNKDIVARLPRATMRGISLDYQHAGRTVMVAEDPAEPPWIQGEVMLYALSTNQIRSSRSSRAFGHTYP